MNITVYCGANFGKDKRHKNSAIELGTWIAKNGHTLVYGGGNIGLMGLVADTVLQNGGNVIGVIPQFLIDKEMAHFGLTKLYTVQTMSERKNKMVELGDCYIALSGGIGTLEEIIEVISWARLGQNANPCIFYNSTGYYDMLDNFIKSMVTEEFLSRRDYEKILFAKNTDDMEVFIEEYIPPEF